jgi:hypothetical protein
VHGTAYEEFVCDVVDELADWDYLKVSMKVRYRSARGENPRGGILIDRLVDDDDWLEMLSSIPLQHM